jgi:hypothetical protein
MMKVETGMMGLLTSERATHCCFTRTISNKENNLIFGMGLASLSIDTTDAASHVAIALLSSCKLNATSCLPYSGTKRGTA